MIRIDIPKSNKMTMTNTTTFIQQSLWSTKRTDSAGSGLPHHKHILQLTYKTKFIQTLSNKVLNSKQNNNNTIIKYLAIF